MNKKVFVTAISNTAVDNLLEKLHESKMMNNKMVRIGHPIRIKQYLEEYSLDYQISQSQNYKEIKKLRA
jgi:hypothetical protein